jgi:hypothetical protein
MGVPLAASPLLLTGSAKGSQSAGAPSSKQDGWVSLFNGRNLDGWYTFLPSSGKNSDSKHVFKVEQGMLHILDIPVTAEDQEFGYMATDREFSNCRVLVEYKWGTKRFHPRIEAKRDNGLLYFLVGEDRVWPTFVECQIQETDTGDLWILGGSVVTEGRGPGRRKPNTQSSGRFFKDGDFEDRTGWNTVEVILQGNRATHLVNGRIVNGGYDIKRPDPENANQLVSLDRGRIALQAEGAEIWYRSVKVRPLS